MAGQFGAWVPIGAVQTASGYDVAWEIPGRQRVYGLDHRQQRQLPLHISASCREPALRWNRSQPIFGQDLNGDGVIGTTTVIQTESSFGSTSLTEVWYDYFLV